MTPMYPASLLKGALVLSVSYVVSIANLCPYYRTSYAKGVLLESSTSKAGSSTFTDPNTIPIFLFNFRKFIICILFSY